MKTLVVIGGTSVTQYDDGRVAYIARGTIDADGANGLSRHPLTREPLFAYAPEDKGLDSLSGSAGYPNHSWWRNILVNTDDNPTTPEDEKGHGSVCVFNGGYYSKTEWFNASKDWNDPSRYLDSCALPYFVVPPQVRLQARGVVLGCAGRVTFRGISVDCIVGDIGPHDHIGEMSIGTADRVGINSSPRHGGTEHFQILYELWPGISAVIAGNSYRLIPA